jgi:hypothetical protein
MIRADEIPHCVFSDISSKFVDVRTICFAGETAGLLVKEWSQSFSRQTFTFEFPT